VAPVIESIDSSDAALGLRMAQFDAGSGAIKLECPHSHKAAWIDFF